MAEEFESALLATEEDARERTRGLLRTNGETYRHLREAQMGEEAAFIRPPFFIMWCPPHGHVIAAPTIEEAQRAASNFAGEHPAKVAAVYQLVGYAHVPFKPASFLPVAGPEPDEEVSR